MGPFYIKIISFLIKRRLFLHNCTVDLALFRFCTGFGKGGGHNNSRLIKCDWLLQKSFKRGEVPLTVPDAAIWDQRFFMRHIILYQWPHHVKASDCLRGASFHFIL